MGDVAELVTVLNKWKPRFDESLTNEQIDEFNNELRSSLPGVDMVMLLNAYLLASLDGEQTIAEYMSNTLTGEWISRDRPDWIGFFAGRK